MSSGEHWPFRHVQSRYVPAYYGLREVLLRSGMVTQEELEFFLLLLFILYAKRVTPLALKPAYQVALFINIFNIDSIKYLQYYTNKKNGNI